MQKVDMQKNKKVKEQTTALDWSYFYWNFQKVQKIIAM